MTSDGPKKTTRYCPYCLWPCYKHAGVTTVECRTHGFMPRARTLNSPAAHAEMARRRMKGAS